MLAIERALEGLSFVPDALRDGLRRRVRELAGLALIVLALLLAIALATWSVQDPSLSHATSRPVRNLLGMPGAVVADLLMQLFGLASLALVLPIAVWGWRFLSHRPLQRERLRLLFWILGALFATACAAALPRGATWPLPAGLGGVIGDWLIRLPAVLVGGKLSVPARTACALVCAIGAIACLAVVFGYGLHGAKSNRRAHVGSQEKRTEGGR